MDDYTKTLLEIIDKEKLNKKLKWCGYTIFKEYLKKVLNKDLDECNVENYIKIIELESENFKFNEKNYYKSIDNNISQNTKENKSLKSKIIQIK